MSNLPQTERIGRGEHLAENAIPGTGDGLSGEFPQPRPGEP